MVQRFVDAWVCFPSLIILITAMSIVGPGLAQILFVLGISGGIGASRFKRSLVFAIRENQYISASQAIGARPGYVMWRHILPNIMPMVVVVFSGTMGGMIMAEAGLSFLGLGLPPPYPSWGGMIAGEGRANMLMAPWMLLWPGLALTFVIFGINMFGDALRDLLDPRLRGGLGSYRLDKGEEIARKIRAKMESAKPQIEQDIAALKKK
ncbi:MAG: ABC transporter permease [Dehalococcoidales bacterium]|nr:ABC transporter permease [Dehalococcoidales bacterium]